MARDHDLLPTYLVLVPYGKNTFLSTGMYFCNSWKLALCYAQGIKLQQPKRTLLTIFLLFGIFHVLHITFMQILNHKDLEVYDTIT